MGHTIERQRRQMGMIDEPCTLCGHDGLCLIESRRVVHGIALRQRLQGAHVRRYKQCPSCGAQSEQAS